MSKALKAVTFRLEQDIVDGLLQIKERDGVPVVEQVRRALRAWLNERGIAPKTERKRAGTRRRS